MEDLLTTYGPVCSTANSEDPHVYALSVALSWARKRGFEVRRNAERISVLWLTPADAYTPIEGLHGVPGTLHLLPGSLSIVLSAYTYRGPTVASERYTAFPIDENLDERLTRFFDEVAWPTRH